MLMAGAGRQSAGALSGVETMPFNRFGLAAILLLAGCAAQAEPDRYDVLSHRDPVEAERESATPAYRSVLSGYHPRQVVEPEPWAGTPPAEGGAQ
jgi:hypothetical protein